MGGKGERNGRQITPSVPLPLPPLSSRPMHAIARGYPLFSSSQVDGPLGIAAVAARRCRAAGSPEGRLELTRALADSKGAWGGKAFLVTDGGTFLG